MTTKKLTLPLMLALICGSASADVIPLLGGAQQFAVLGAQTVTNAGTTTLHGDIGTAPGTAATGMGSVVFVSGGGVHQDDAGARRAQADARSAYDLLQALAGGTELSGQDLGSAGPFGAGVYRYASSAALTGAMTIDFGNDPTGMVVFQIGSTLTTAADAVVNVINGTSSNGIYFLVGSSASLGSNAVLAGNILAQQSISFGTGASIACGRALALGAAVTLDRNQVSNDCGAYAPGGAGDFGSSGYSGAGVAALPSGEVPEPATLGLFGLGLCVVMARRRSRQAGSPAARLKPAAGAR